MQSLNRSITIVIDEIPDNVAIYKFQEDEILYL